MPKTPDEIKKGLECKKRVFADSCYDRCATCELFIPCYGTVERCADALALIQQLQQNNAQLAIDKAMMAAENAEKDARIQQFEKDNDQLRNYIRLLQAERDAAVEDMKHAAIYLCCACKNYHPAVRGVSHHYCEVLGKRDDFTGAISCGMFKWRGVQKEECK